MLIPKNIFPISKLASKEDKAYTLNCVCLRRGKKGKPTAIVTDGHLLVEVSWKEMDGKNFPDVGIDATANPACNLNIPTAEWDEAGKNIKKSVIPVLENVLVDEVARNYNKDTNQHVITLASTDCGTTRRLDVRATPGKFPDYEKVLWKPQLIHDRMNLGELKKVKDTRLAAKVTVNAKLLKAALDVVVQIQGGKEMCPISFEVPLDPLAPIRFLAKGEGDEEAVITGMIMPVREGVWDEKYENVKKPVYPYEEETIVPVDETKEPLGEMETGEEETAA